MDFKSGYYQINFDKGNTDLVVREHNGLLSKYSPERDEWLTADVTGSILAEAYLERALLTRPEAVIYIGPL